MTLAVLIFFLYLNPSGAEAEPSEHLLVFAAASMTEVLQEAGSLYSESSGNTVAFSFAGSSTLARQIDQGAPADVYVSANRDWVDFLAKRGRLTERGPVVFASGRLVAIAPTDVEVSIRPLRTLSIVDAFSGRLAIADPAHVPAGQYAKQTLKSLGWWEPLSSRLAIGGDVRGALAYVERGACDLGIVYATDARISKRVKIVATFPDSLHTPIQYLAATVAASRKSGARGFVRFLDTTPVKRILEDAGFRIANRNSVE